MAPERAKEEDAMSNYPPGMPSGYRSKTVLRCPQCEGERSATLYSELGMTYFEDDAEDGYCRKCCIEMENTGEEPYDPRWDDDGCSE
jgi:hypothetical protein